MLSLVLSFPNILKNKHSMCRIFLKEMKRNMFVLHVQFSSLSARWGCGILRVVGMRACAMRCKHFGRPPSEFCRRSCTRIRPWAGPTSQCELAVPKTSYANLGNLDIVCCRSLRKTFLSFLRRGHIFVHGKRTTFVAAG